MEPSNSVQRKLSFNMERSYRWDVQEQSGCISFSSFGVTITKRPLDLLDESFDRSDVSCPVSLVQLDKSHSPIVAKKQVLPVPAVIDHQKSNQGQNHGHDHRSFFSLGDWLCTRFTGAEPSISTGDQPSLSRSVDGTVRLPEDIRKKLMIDYHDEDDDDEPHQVKRAVRQRCPLPTFPSPPPPEEIDADYSDDGEEETFCPHFSLVA